MKKTVTLHFPLGRIKRIMQTDEDVGKLAISTPAAVCCAMQEFMKELVEKTLNELSEEENKEGKKSKITVEHLKLVFEKYEKFDFLRGVARSFSERPEEEEPKKRRVEKE